MRLGIRPARLLCLCLSFGAAGGVYPILAVAQELRSANESIDSPDANRAISAIVSTNRKIWNVDPAESALAQELSKTRRLLVSAMVFAGEGPLASEGNPLRAHLAALEQAFEAYNPIRLRVSHEGRAHVAELRAAGSSLVRSLREMCDAPTRETRARIARELLSEIEARNPRARWKRDHPSKPTFQNMYQPELDGDGAGP